MQVINGAQQNQSSIDTEGQKLCEGAEKMGKIICVTLLFHAPWEATVVFPKFLSM